MYNAPQRRLTRSALPTAAASAAFVVLAALGTAANGQSPTARLAVVAPSTAQPVAAQPVAVPTQNPQQASNAALEAVGAGDMLRINVFRNPDLNTEARVTDQGTVLFPLIGEIQVTGLTPNQVGSRIADMLRAGKFVVNPEVSVSMAQVNSRQVSVLGNVNKPGRYPIDAMNSKLTDFLKTTADSLLT